MIDKPRLEGGSRGPEGSSELRIWPKVISVLSYSSGGGIRSGEVETMK